MFCAGNYAPLCIRTVSTSVRTTKTRPNTSSLGELSIERLGFALGKERFRAASNGAGQAGALAGLHQHDHGHGETGNQLDNRQNQFQSSHGIHPFMVGEII